MTARSVAAGSRSRYCHVVLGARCICLSPGPRTNGEIGHMARTANARTRNEELYLQIRARLLRGEFGPGEPIRTDVLSSRYSVSVSVVREVLTRLAAQGLIRT